MASVTHVENDDGSQSIGVKVGKQFVPFVTLDAARIEQLRENAEQRGGGGKEPESEEKS